MTVSLELQAKIIEWRRKAADNTLSVDEMKEITKLLRQGRLSAAASSSAAKRSAATKIIPNADEFLSEIENLG